MNATPLIFFRGAPHGGRAKGHVRFEGFGLIERAELISQWDGKREEAFSNYVFDCAVLNMTVENEDFDWKWINSRWNPSASHKDCLALAPASWQEWVKKGSPALPRIRRRLARLHTIPRSEQCPDPGSEEDTILKEIYAYFEGRKERFEAVAELVTERVLGGSGNYVRGWITPAGGDNGIDFVGRLDGNSPPRWDDSPQVEGQRGAASRISAETHLPQRDKVTFSGTPLANP